MGTYQLEGNKLNISYYTIHGGKTLGGVVDCEKLSSIMSYR